jgi:hypothetical protein
MAAERFQKTCRIPSYTLFTDELSTMENSIYAAQRSCRKSGRHIAALKYLKQEARMKNYNDQGSGFCFELKLGAMQLRGKWASQPAGH